MKLFGKPERPPYRIFFATDVHGSDRCFRKFLAAATAYRADALILGGDVAGKAMVPIVDEGESRYSYSFQGVRETVGATSLVEVQQRLNFNGFYPRIAERVEVDRMNEDPAYVVELFEQTITAQLSGWCELAAERLPEHVRCLITPGNDDPVAIDAVLSAAPKIECPERAIVQLGPIWLASLGNTNRTPWDTDREYDEPVLAEQIREMVDPYADGRPLVFNFHCPPFASGLDTAVQLDDDFRPVIQHGTPHEIPVGSIAVREAIEGYQPVAALHGHIHESAGAIQIGPTWAFNPGSDYASGYLKGLVLDLGEGGEYRNHLFTNG